MLAIGDALAGVDHYLRATGQPEALRLGVLVRPGPTPFASCLCTAGYTSHFGLRHNNVQQRLVVRLTRAATRHNELPVALDEADHSGCS